MTPTTQANQTANYRSTGAPTRGNSSVIGSGIPLIGRLLRRRSRKAVATMEADDASTSRRARPHHEPEALRSSMEAGITRGVSVFFR